MCGYINHPALDRSFLTQTLWYRHWRTLSVLPALAHHALPAEDGSCNKRPEQRSREPRGGDR